MSGLIDNIAENRIRELEQENRQLRTVLGFCIGTLEVAQKESPERVKENLRSLLNTLISGREEVRDLMEGG